MITLRSHGVYLKDGVPVPGGEGFPTPNEVRERTISSAILRAHNVSEKPGKFNIRFDKLISHDITYVGVIQTARGSGLTSFPVPYAMTNCHNSLCAVGGTINEDDHVLPFRREEVRRHIRARQPERHSHVRARGDGGMRQHDIRLGQPYPLWRNRHHGRGRRRAGNCEAASKEHV